MPHWRSGEAGVILASPVVDPPFSIVLSQCIEKDAVGIFRNEGVGSLCGEPIFKGVLLFSEEGGPRKPTQYLFRVGLGQVHFSYAIEVPCMCAAGKKNDIVGLCRVIFPKCKATFAAWQNVLVLVRLPMQQILGVGNNSEIEIHHELAIDLYGFIMRVLQNHSVPMRPFGVGKDDADVLPIEQVLRCGKKDPVLPIVFRVVQEPLIAEQVICVLIANDIRVEIDVFGIFAFAKEGTVLSVFFEVYAVFTDRNSNVVEDIAL